MKPPVHRFEAIVLPHLDAAYNLARWLVRDEHAAEDVVQEAYLRALRYFDAFRGSEIGECHGGIVGGVGGVRQRQFQPGHFRQFGARDRARKMCCVPAQRAAGMALRQLPHHGRESRQTGIAAEFRKSSMVMIYLPLVTTERS